MLDETEFASRSDCSTNVLKTTGQAGSVESEQTKTLPHSPTSRVGGMRRKPLKFRMIYYI